MQGEINGYGWLIFYFLFYQQICAGPNYDGHCLQGTSCSFNHVFWDQGRKRDSSAIVDGMYVRPLNQAHRDNGEYVALVLPMQETDDEEHHQYLGIFIGKFDDILRRIIPLIIHHYTHSELAC